MAIEVEITISAEDTILTPTTITIPCRFRTTTNMQLQSLSVVLSQGGLTPANFVSQFKTAALAALSADYGINVNANSVILYGAPQ